MEWENALLQDQDEVTLRVPQLQAVIGAGLLQVEPDVPFWHRSGKIIFII